jgi:hypothetical protein
MLRGNLPPLKHPLLTPFEPMKITDCKSDWTPRNYNVTARERQQIKMLIAQNAVGNFKIGRTRIEVVSLAPFRCIMRKVQGEWIGTSEQVGFFEAKN